MEEQFTTIYIVRHAESMGNAHYTSGGDILPNLELGTNLSELGIKQAKNIAEKLKNIHFDAIFSSDYIRAKSTAEIIASKHNLNVITSSQIRERDLGSMEGKLTPEMQKKIKALQKNMTDEEKIKFKISNDIESEEEMLKRFLDFLNKIIQQYKGKTILVVNHANIMRILLVYLKYVKYDELIIGSIQNTGYIKLVTDGNNYFVREIWGIKKQIIK